MSELLPGKKSVAIATAALPKSACSDSEEKEDDDDDNNLSGVGRRSGGLHLTLTRYADARFATRHPTRDILSELLLEDVRKPRERRMVLPETALQNDSESEYAHEHPRFCALFA